MVPVYTVTCNIHLTIIINIIIICMYMYNTTYVPVLICTVELDSPTPIQLTAEILMLYMTACFNRKHF